MTPDQKAKLLSLVRKYGEAEVTWTKQFNSYVSSPIQMQIPTSQPVTNAYKAVVDFVHTL